MAKAVKAPIRTKTEASRDIYDEAEGGAVADEAWFNAQNPKSGSSDQITACKATTQTPCA